MCTRAVERIARVPDFLSFDDVGPQAVVVWKDCFVDAVADYRTASEANDVDALMETLAPDAELVSPISGRMVFRGRDDLRVLLGAVYGSLTQLKWREEVGQDAVRVVMGDCAIGPLKLGDAMVLELAADGQIRRIRPYLRPWLALTLFALKLGPKVARHPGLLWRALRRG
jgi:ribosomal protein S28E/S33